MLKSPTVVKAKRVNGAESIKVTITKRYKYATLRVVSVPLLISIAMEIAKVKFVAKPMVYV